ncbi:MAG: HAD-IB family phosphatase [Myxococcota bacterium]
MSRSHADPRGKPHVDPELHLAPILRDALAGRVDALRLGVRLASPEHAGGVLLPASEGEFAPDDLSPGVRRLSSLEIALDRRDHGDAVTFDWSVRNLSDRDVQLESVVMGLRWTGRWAEGPIRFLRHGWQSWSQTGVRDLDPDGEPAFPSGEWLRGMHHAVGAPPPDRQGWHESEIVSVVGSSSGGGVCLAGVLETGIGFGIVYLREEEKAIRVELEIRVEVPIAPGERRRLESVRVALGSEPSRLLECFAEAWGRRAGGRTRGRFQTGWCSWYHLFRDVDEQAVLRAVEVLAAEREAFPVSVVQLDDGYQREVGDWLATNAKFPRGLEPLARDVEAAGFTPGLWTAPFCVVPESRLFARHPDWLLRNGEDFFCGLVHPAWTQRGAVHALDTSRPEVLAHLEQVFRQLRAMGFSYLKLDFLHSVAMRCDAHDPCVSRAERLRRGLQAVRSGAGEDAFLLGCGSPLGPAVGVVDAMRIGPDVAPHWGIDSEGAGEAAAAGPIPGLEDVLPSARNSLRNGIHRTWMHRRIWINDPDCLLVRTRGTQLSPQETQTLATAVALTGGMVIFSDDPKALSESERKRLRETIGLAREVDAGGRVGVVRAPRLLAGGAGHLLVADRVPDAALASFNLADSRWRERLDPGSLGLGPIDATPAPEAVLARLRSDALEVDLAPHDGALVRLPGARPLALFCDFDGTFSVQDVGATIARERAGDRRPALWARYERGELSAWDYNMELLDGLVLPEEELDRFLGGIELDPGAKPLLDWCRERGFPLTILSDGFDHNLKRLQRMHGIHFPFAANRLRYEGDTWRIAPGYPDPNCRCGTGTCKRGRITAYRKERPGAFCVHIGDGRVSDLCGALAADLTFAKGSLAEVLEDWGRAYLPFASLFDVIAELEALLEPDSRVLHGDPTPGVQR